MIPAILFDHPIVGVGQGVLAIEQLEVPPEASTISQCRRRGHTGELQGAWSKLPKINYSTTPNIARTKKIFNLCTEILTLYFPLT